MANTKNGKHMSGTTIIIILVAVLLLGGIAIFAQDKIKGSNSNNVYEGGNETKAVINESGSANVYIDSEFSTEDAFTSLSRQGYFNDLAEEDMLVLKKVFGKKVNLDLTEADGISKPDFYKDIVKEGKPTIIDYMNTECQGCRSLHDMMNTMYNQGDFTFIEVTTRQTPEELANYITKEQKGVMKIPSYVADVKFSDELGFQYTPTLLYLNDEGYVYWVSGPLQYKEMLNRTQTQVSFEFIQ